MMNLRRIASCQSVRRVAWGLLGALAWLACLPSFAAGHQCAANNWPLWESWASRYVQNDGRMLNTSLKPNHSTSEGQAYGMMFALIGNDPERFAHLWQWNAVNLLGSDLKSRLPGWLWGKGEDGQWQLQDANSASDADLWMVYALLEASRLWRRPDYREAALSLLDTIESTLVADLPGLGKMLLPGPVGFVHANKLWTLNPSYLPLPLLRRLAKVHPAGPWKEIADNTVKLILSSSPKGYVADWVGYRMTAQQAGLFVTDPNQGGVGSYDAIRVYLWAGMTPRKDAAFAPLLAALDGMRQGTGASGAPPEKVQVSSGVLEGQAPFGYAAALVPYFIAKNEARLAGQLQRHTEKSIAEAFAAEQQHPEILYYNIMLSLFSLGWVEQRYQFRDDGTLKLSWESSCVRAVLR